ncbi:MAG TPA: ABC transporter ATP-binding protein, partial [Thermoleophilaceae bacterium]
MERVNGNGQVGHGPLLQVRNLRVDFRMPRGVVRAVDGLTYELDKGRTLAIVGESGSGKTVSSRAIMGLLAPTARVQGSIAFEGGELVGLSEEKMRRLRGRSIAMVFQDPSRSLNPTMRIGKQITEAIDQHADVRHAEATNRAVELMELVRLPAAQERFSQYPHQLSGGMRQRVMIAIALAGRPKVLIADEPTTALDVTVQAQILDLIRSLQREFGMALILITHDMGVVAEMADRVVVVNEARAVETGPVERIFSAPESDYTRMLLSAVPRLGAMRGIDTPLRAKGGARSPAPPVLEVDDLTVRFDLKVGLLRHRARVHAVEGVSFALRQAETLALVGESGCGKSTTGKALLGLVPWEGAIKVAGRSAHDLGASGMKALRRDIQMVFQDPYGSLDPRMRIARIVAEPLPRGLARAEKAARTAAGLAAVGLD